MLFGAPITEIVRCCPFFQERSSSSSSSSIAILCFAIRFFESRTRGTPLFLLSNERRHTCPCRVARSVSCLPPRVNVPPFFLQLRNHLRPPFGAASVGSLSCVAWYAHCTVCPSCRRRRRRHDPRRRYRTIHPCGHRVPLIMFPSMDVSI